jgi:hypothetical protein
MLTKEREAQLRSTVATLGESLGDMQDVADLLSEIDRLRADAGKWWIGAIDDAEFYRRIRPATVATAKQSGERPWPW